MPKTRLLWQLYPSYLLIALVPLAAVMWYTSDRLRQFDLEQTANDLEARALLLEDLFRELLLKGDAREIDRSCKRLGEEAATRITVVLPSGEVVGDTNESPARMGNHADRQEIREATAQGSGRAVRYSETLKEHLMYVALAVKAGDRLVGIVRTSIPATTIDHALNGIYQKIFAGALLVALVMTGVSLVVSRRISRPLEELRQGAERFARGDLNHRLRVGGSREIEALAQTMNQMATDLDDRIRALVQQRNERGAILSSMVEGVLAVDSRQRLISLNEAAARMIGVKAQAAQGRSLQEVVRNPQLQDLVAEVLCGHEEKEAEFVLYEREERFLQAHGTVLRDAAAEAIGVLVVLHDVTRIKRLEAVRRDFVANVSHELKTPITSIKGFVETILDGALDKPADARRFLEIVAAQTERLGAIIDDLLDLSRIEKEAERAEIVLTPGPVSKVLQSAIEVCLPKAQDKQIPLEIACEEGLQAAINPPLLEQAVVNLIDNAIKYSPDGRPIHVEAGPADGEVVIRVRDHGCGIGAEHLPRVFERFYRVDKARSRKLGGTGLGLAIVKHIAQAHGGHATVESVLGEGSTFTIHLPAK